MARLTSIEVYKKIQKDGLLSKKRWEIYHVLYSYGLQTSAEVMMRLNENEKKAVYSQSRARFTELREMGVICEVGTKLCSITGNNVIAWRVTDELPVKIIKINKLKLKKEILLKIQNLGINLPEEYKQELRDIYHEVKKL